MSSYTQERENTSQSIDKDILENKENASDKLSKFILDRAQY